MLFLTTMSGIDDRVEGLEGGGDDYLAKPFALAELLARVNAITRRGDQRPDHAARGRSGNGSDPARTCSRAGKAVDLQPQEFRLLEYMLRNAGRVVTRTMLLENVWELHFDPRTNIVETHMSRLRGKMDRGHARRTDPYHSRHGLYPACGLEFLHTEGFRLAAIFVAIFALSAAGPGSAVSS